MMYSLEQALLEHELIVLRVLGEWWELDLTGQEKLACAQSLATQLGQLDINAELGFLPQEEGDAFHALVSAGGRLPVATFARTYGEVRQMGPGRLEREEPWYEPANVAEALWYRGLLYRGFDETSDGVIEFYYLPAEFMAQFEKADAVAPPEPASTTTMIPAAAPVNHETAVSNALDDLTTLLAEGQRYGLQGEWRRKTGNLLVDDDPVRLSLLLTMAKEMGLLRKQESGLRPARAAVPWLKQSRESQLRALADAWSGSNWNELRRTPGIMCEGEGWQNDPILARTALFDVLPREESWYVLRDLVNVIKNSEPDFQRPDGNYDTWYIRDEVTDAYLNGFEQWDYVEGRLLRYLVEGPMRWLGLAETGLAADNEPLYRLTPRAVAWLLNEDPGSTDVPVPLVVQADGSVQVPFNANRYQRFQTARISEPEPYQLDKPYSYRITPASLAAAEDEGISADRVQQFLEQASSRPLPASVKRAITRWAEQGVEARLETAVILSVQDAGILETLAANPKTRDFLGQRLGELAVTIRRDQWPAFRAATAQLGLLLDVDVHED